MEKNQRGGTISRQQFEEMRKAYAEKYPDQTKSVLFSSDVVAKTLVKDNVRVYFGLDAEGRTTVIFMAEGSGGQQEALAMPDPPVNMGQLCPPYC